MIDIKTVDLFCGCGYKVSNSFPNSEHYCRVCDRWLVFRDGKMIDSQPMELWKSGKRFLTGHNQGGSKSPGNER